MTDFDTAAASTEDKTLPVIVYVLYFLGLTHGITMVIGLIIAYVARDGAGPRMASHYTWLIRTFWITLAAFVIGGLIAVVGLVLLVVLVGFPIMWVGGLICGAAWVLCLIRLIMGAVHLARDEGYPRPYAVVA